MPLMTASSDRRNSRPHHITGTREIVTAVALSAGCPEIGSRAAPTIRSIGPAEPNGRSNASERRFRRTAVRATNILGALQLRDGFSRQPTAGYAKTPCVV